MYKMSLMVLLSSVESFQTFSEVPRCCGEILHSRKQGICKYKTVQTGLNLFLLLCNGIKPSKILYKMQRHAQTGKKFVVLKKN